MTVSLVYDATGANMHLIPAGARWVAGYTTGSGGVPWSAAQFAQHPGAIRICQNPQLTDDTADIADIEPLAGEYGAAAGWYRRAQLARLAGDRPGQRPPGFYASQANIPTLIRALIAGGVTHGPALWIAHWNVGEAVAGHSITEAGPFPVAGFQFTALGTYDVSVFDDHWLTPSQPFPPPPVPGWAIVAESDLRQIARLTTSVITAIEHNAH